MWNEPARQVFKQALETGTAAAVVVAADAAAAGNDMKVKLRWLEAKKLDSTKWKR